MVTRNGTVTVPSLCSSQEEADMRIILHASDIAVNHKTLIVWSPDTDVAVLLIYFIRQLVISLWLKTGTKDAVRFIPVHSVSEKMGSIMCEILPALHSLTGCDTTSAFFGIGKVKPFLIVKENVDKFLQLRNFGQNAMLPPEVISQAKLLTAKIYHSVVENDNINYLRYYLFCKKLAKSKNLPPTEDSLLLHIQGANFQCLIRKEALNPRHDAFSPLGHGLILQDEAIVPVLMSKEPVPASLLEVTTCSCKASKCQGRCSCSSQGLACTLVCSSEGEDNCMNPNRTSPTPENDSESENSEDD